MGSVQIQSGSTYDQYITNASNKYGVPVSLIKAVIKQESGGQPNVTSRTGAGGLMQLMPKTAAGLGVTNVYDPQQNIDGGTKYLAQAIKNNNGSIPLALAAYNAGQGNVDKYHGIPPFKETQNYVSSIMSMYGSNNIDLGAINTTGTTGNPLDIGATIVNGFQKIFQMIVTDTTKFLIYLILFVVFIFFGYKALQGSPPVAGTIQAGKQAGSAAKKTVKTIIKVMPK